MKKLSLVICLITFSALIFTGCKKGSNDDQNLDDYNTLKSAKFTITTANLLTSDNFNIIFTGGDAQGAATTILKINGTPQTNQRNVVLTYAQLKAGVTVETTTPLNTLVMGISGYSGTANHTFSFFIKPVINGTAQADLSGTLTQTSYTKDFTYK